MLVVYDVDKPPDELVDELDGKIRDGEVESAKALARALVQRRDDLGFDVVLEATRRGISDVVRALIEAGADVNRAGNDGQTPLNRAADDDVTSLYVGAQQGHEAGAGADRGGRGRQQGKK